MGEGGDDTRGSEGMTMVEGCRVTLGCEWIPAFAGMTPERRNTTEGVSIFQSKFEP